MQTNNWYEVVGGETLQPVRPIEQIVKETAVACKLVSDGASIDECDIYTSIITRCLMHTVISYAHYLKNQEVILYNGANKSHLPYQPTFVFSRNMWYDYQKQYMECPTEYYHHCPLPCSIYSYDFDIKALTSVVLGHDRQYRAKAVAISESNLIDGRFTSTGKNAYYYFQFDSGMQKLTIPSSYHLGIFPIKLRGIFSFIDKDCVLDECGKPKMSFTINQKSDTRYLEALTDEELTSVIMMTVPTILTQLGKGDSITPSMYEIAKMALGNIKAVSKLPTYPFLI